MWFITFRKAVLAGIAIGLGGYAFLVAGGLPGAVLFSFGLLTVVHYELALFTGKAGYFDSLKALGTLFGIILTGNVAGCLLMGVIAWPDICGNDIAFVASQNIVAKRLEAGFLANFILAIPCGFIMTTAVEFGRKKHFLPLLFGVPLFIMCGFRHSIADAFYYLVACVFSYKLVLIWLLIVAGNFIGCNLYRAVLYDNSKL